MNRIIVCCLAVLSLSLTGMADDKAEVTAITKKAVDNIIAILQDKSLDEPAAKEKVKVELLKVFDLPLTAKLTLGRRHWPKLNKEQRKAFQALFISNLVDTYFDKAKLFSDKEVIYEKTIKVKTKIHVAIHCTSKGEKITINNKFYKSRNGWKVYDLEIQDISIVRSYGSQYDAILKDGTVEKLLDEMRKRKAPEKKKDN